MWPLSSSLIELLIERVGLGGGSAALLDTRFVAYFVPAWADVAAAATTASAMKAMRFIMARSPWGVVAADSGLVRAACDCVRTTGECSRASRRTRETRVLVAQKSSESR